MTSPGAKLPSPPTRIASASPRALPQILALARSTFSEVSRQPLHGLIVLVTLFAFALSPSLAMFTLSDDLKLLKDFGVSTLFISGLFLAVSGVTGVVGRELESGTAQTLLSKPVGRGVFLMGKLFGVLAAVLASVYVFLLALLFAARIGPPGSAHDPVDWPAITAALAAFVLALLAGAWRSLRFGKPFGVAALQAACLTFSGGFLTAELFDRSWGWNPFGLGFDPLLIEAAALSVLGVFLFGAVSVLLSVLFGRGALPGTFIVFVAGLALGSGGSPALGLVPDLQVFWVGEIFYKAEGLLPVQYVGVAALYSVLYSAACLAASAWVLERREG